MLFLVLSFSLYLDARCIGCERTALGRIFRSSATVRQFREQTGFAAGRPGYVVDHIVPLACASELGLSVRDLDAPSNMQWQTKHSAKAKDRWERRHCRELSRDPGFRPYSLPGASRSAR